MSLFSRLARNSGSAASNPDPAPVLVVSFADQMRAHLAAVQSQVRRAGSQVPIRAALILFRICDQIGEVVDHMERADRAGRPATAHERIAVEFMVSDYVPSTVAAFVLSHAPAEQRDASFIDQVALLWGEVRKMIDAIYDDDDNALTANAAFLRAKFG